MNNLDFNLIAQHIAARAGDKALANAMASQHSDFYNAVREWVETVESCKAKEAPSPFPAIPTLTAIQTAIFDNWPEGHRVSGKPNRYGMAIEFWTAPKDKIQTHRKGDYQRKANVVLMNKKDLGKWLVRAIKENGKRKYPLSMDYLNGLQVMQQGMDENVLIGVLAEKAPGDGTIFFDFQMIVVKLDGETTTAALMIDGEPIKLPQFSEQQANGQPFPKGARGRVILQSRCDLSGFSTTWATGEAA